MKVTFHFSEHARPQLLRWRDWLAGREPNGREIALTTLASLSPTMISCRGEIDGAVQVPGIHPPVFRWMFYPGWWLCYIRSDRSVLGLFARREITVIKVVQSRTLPKFP